MKNFQNPSIRRGRPVGSDNEGSGSTQSSRSVEDILGATGRIRVNGAQARPQHAQCQAKPLIGPIGPVGSLVMPGGRMLPCFCGRA